MKKLSLIQKVAIAVSIVVALLYFLDHANLYSLVPERKFLGSQNCLQSAEIIHTIETDHATLQGVWSIYVDIPQSADIIGNVAGYQNTLVLNTFCNGLMAFDATSGDVIWSTDTEAKTLILSDDAVYTTSGNRVLAFGLSTGTLQWEYFNTSGRRGGSSLRGLQSGDLLFYWATANSSGHLQEIDSHTGSLSASLTPAHDNLIYYDNGIVLLQDNRARMAINMADESVIWERSDPQFTTIFRYRPLLYSNQLIVRQDSTEQPLLALDWQSGDVLWKVNDQAITSNLSLHENKLYFINRALQLQVIDLTTGLLRTIAEFSPASIAEDSSQQIAVYGDKVSVYFQDAGILTTYTLNLLTR